MAAIYINSSFFMILILTIILVKIYTDINWKSAKRSCMTFVLIVMLYVIFDASFVLCFLNEGKNVPLYRIIVLLFYLIYVIMPYNWHLFMRKYIGEYNNKFLQRIQIIPLIVLIVMVLISVPTGILWSIDDSGLYKRGSLFFVFAIINLFYYITAFFRAVSVLVFNEYEKKDYLIRATFFSAVPLIGIVLNTYVIPVYEIYPVQPFCLVVGTILAYLFMIDRQNNIVEKRQKERLFEAFEREKEATEKARDAERAKGIFLTNMYHDVRTPMNAILGFADIIEKNPTDVECVIDSISKIQASGDVLMKIINDVLSLCEIDNGKISIENKPVYLPKLLNQLENVVEGRLKGSDIEFRVDTEITNPYVMCDDTKLLQIMLNLLSNSAKFTNKGGIIILEVKQGMVTDGKSGLTICVRDNGIGMSEKFIKHAFDSFERERTSTESGIQGTGLGLAIVKKLVDMMEGNISIDSKKGLGTSIIINLELDLWDESNIKKADFAGDYKKPVANDSEWLNAAIKKCQGKKVLLVEDNVLNAEIAMTMLLELKISVEWMKNGIECIDRLNMCEPGTYDIILMDIQMPVMDGCEATEIIRNMKNVNSEIPVIAITANAFRKDVEKAMMSGMNGYILKPFSVKEFISQIEKL